MAYKWEESVGKKGKQIQELLSPSYPSRPLILVYLQVLYNMPLQKKQIKQSHSVDFCTENRVLFFEENWNLQILRLPLKIVLSESIWFFPIV